MRCPAHLPGTPHTLATDGCLGRSAHAPILHVPGIGEDHRIVWEAGGLDHAWDRERQRGNMRFCQRHTLARTPYDSSPCRVAPMSGDSAMRRVSHQPKGKEKSDATPPNWPPQRA